LEPESESQLGKQRVIGMNCLVPRAHLQTVFIHLALPVGSFPKSRALCSLFFQVGNKIL